MLGHKGKTFFLVCFDIFELEHPLVLFLFYFILFLFIGATFLCSHSYKSVISAECIHLLLAHGAPVKVKNLNGWSPLAEAISFGDRQTSKFHFIDLSTGRPTLLLRIIRQ